MRSRPQINSTKPLPLTDVVHIAGRQTPRYVPRVARTRAIQVLNRGIVSADQLHEVAAVDSDGTTQSHQVMRCVPHVVRNRSISVVNRGVVSADQLDEAAAADGRYVR